MTLLTRYLTKLLMITFILISCNKESTSIDSSIGKGSFIFQTEKFEGGICTKTPSSQNLANEYDVSINCPPGNAVIIYNMPKNSSGSYSIYDPMSSSVLGSNKPWLAVVFQPNTTFYNLGIGLPNSSTGTITKTGSNSFTFNCQVYYNLNPSKKYTVSGQGSY
jgi:hypothetical protein